MSSLTRTVSILTLLAAVTLAGAPWPTAGDSGQGRERVVTLLDHFKPPLKVRAIKTKLGTLRSGRRFVSEGEDWFERLGVTVVNETGKEVVHIGLQIWFTRPSPVTENP